MKKIESYTFNQFDKTITLTKKFSKAASIMGTAEFTELMGLMEKYPSYTLKVREISKPEKKLTYKGLTARKMREFITWQYREDTDTMKATQSCGRLRQCRSKMILTSQLTENSGYCG